MNKHRLAWFPETAPLKAAPTLLHTFALRAPEKAEVPEAAVPGHDVKLAPRDEAVFLLQLGAEVEHALMVQYLFAGYSLDPAAAPPELRATVQQWQTNILAIAREEMGHLVTVQNLLRCIGGPLCFERDEFPMDTGFYPFKFDLQPLSLTSLAKYVVAEMPAKPTGVPELAEIIELATKGNDGAPVNRVGKLYARITELFAQIPPTDFQGDTLGYQADFAAWGRSNVRTTRDAGSPHPIPAKPSAPQLIVQPIGSYTTAKAALDAISEQGEGENLPKDEEESHFERFLAIYRAFKTAPPHIVKNVATNPSTNAKPEDPGAITDPVSLLWSQLFNVRYRLLLDLLAHALSLEGSLLSETPPSPRGRIIAGAFGEMYNLRALSAIVMAKPLKKAGGKERCGPPFEMPYTLTLPDLPASRWRTHRDVLTCAGLLIETLLPVANGSEVDYLRALAAQDGVFLTFIQSILAPAIAAGR